MAPKPDRPFDAGLVPVCHPVKLAVGGVVPLLYQRSFGASSAVRMESGPESAGACAALEDVRHTWLDRVFDLGHYRVLRSCVIGRLYARDGNICEPLSVARTKYDGHTSVQAPSVWALYHRSASGGVISCSAAQQGPVRLRLCSSQAKRKGSILGDRMLYGNRGRRNQALLRIKYELHRDHCRRPDLGLLPGTCCSRRIEQRSESVV